MSETDPSEILRLAAQLYPHVGNDTLRAISAAEELFMVSQRKAELEAWARRNVRIDKSWSDGIKHVTGEKRLA